jgi:cytochrome c oxidase accessory protein FixG
MANSKQQKHTNETTISTEEVVVSLYKSADKIYARSVSGTFNNWRWIMVWATQLFFYGVPWLEWGNRQAMLFDLEARRFYVFGLVFNPQDLIYLTFLLIISALSLFLFTAIAGRLWCGYTCPQTVYTEIFMWFETKIEGDRNARMRMDKGDLSGEKLVRKVAKHTVWIVFALWTGFTFVGYFTPIRELAHHFASWTLGPWETFWVFFYGFATYGNAGFMREQVCKYMCPYARFQSAMFDDDTLIVTYDEVRGEPRGIRSKKLGDHTEGLGSCVDCNLCVQVCPTGIDIRKGLQYECIGCGACADACDQVMDKMGFARGLVKYSTANGMQNRWSKQQMWHRVLRPRVLIYSALLGLMVLGLIVGLYFKPSYRVDVTRDRAVISRLAEDGQLENVYRLKIANNAEHMQRFDISVNGLEPLTMEIEEMGSHLEGKTRHEVTLKSGESMNVVVDLKTPDGIQKTGSHEVNFIVKSLDSDEVTFEKSVFIVPNN